MPANSAIQVLDLDFDTIRSGLKTYISARPEFADYNFEGSTIALLLDLLAFNTYQNAFYTSMVGNEMFLDSAQIRENVVSRAKALGYTPRSRRGSSAAITITIEPPDAPDSITISKNLEFTTSIDGVAYKWVTPQTYTLVDDGTGVYSSSAISIVEGEPLTHKWTVDTNTPSNYIIPNEGVDSTSISVVVRDSLGSSEVETFNLADNINDVTGISPVYFLQEVAGERLEVIFGDGILGKALTNNNIVEVSYRVCNGVLTNGVDSFAGPAIIGGYSSVYFSVAYDEKTIGGAEIESIESIKYSAPRSYETQNRAVLAEDYKRLIIRQFPYVSTLNTWGGEDNVPPVYGKVFISIKPTTGVRLGQSRKNEIRDYLNRYSSLSIDPEFIDPTYIYIKPTVKVNYSSSVTSLSAVDIRGLVTAAIQAYETTNLGTFNNKIFRYSRFVDVIDGADTSILSNTTTLLLEKRFSPSPTNSTKYTIYFNNKLIKRTSDNKPSISSSSFTFSNKTSFLEDDGAGIIKTYYLNGSSKIYLNDNQGTVDYEAGIVTLNEFLPQIVSGTSLSIFATPYNNDITTSKYQLMLLGGTSIIVFDEDTSTATSAVTVTTTGSVTQVIESGIGIII